MTLAGQSFQVAFSLFSEDGKREVEVREFQNGEVYVVERELADGGFSHRHSGRMVGPFPSAEDAERFSVSTARFRDGTS